MALATNEMPDYVLGNREGLMWHAKEVADVEFIHKVGEESFKTISGVARSLIHVDHMNFVEECYNTRMPASPCHATGCEQPRSVPCHLFMTAEDQARLQFGLWVGLPTGSGGSALLCTACASAC